MKPYEFTRIYHPRLGKFVYRHKGSGIIVDNIFKPLKNISTSIFKRYAKKAGEKAGKKLGEKVGKKISEKSKGSSREVRRCYNEKISENEKRNIKC